MVVETLTIRVHRLYRFGEENRPLKAFVDLSINNALIISGVRVVDGREGLFVSMPREQGKDQKWYDKVRFMEKTIKDHVSDVVLKAYASE